METGVDQQGRSVAPWESQGNCLGRFPAGGRPLPSGSLSEKVDQPPFLPLSSPGPPSSSQGSPTGSVASKLLSTACPIPCLGNRAPPRGSVGFRQGRFRIARLEYRAIDAPQYLSAHHHLVWNPGHAGGRPVTREQVLSAACETKNCTRESSAWSRPGGWST